MTRETEPDPHWEHLELRHRTEGLAMELLLLWKGRMAGHARARLGEACLVYLDEPNGAAWARTMLAEAMSEWARHT
jgi:hypothetical protein